jgi:hypothetical protein
MTGQAETAFGVIRHWRMEKVLSARSIRARKLSETL